MAASYPTAVKTFTTRSAAQTIGSAHMNDAQDEINAMQTALLTTGLAHHLLFVDATYDIGQSGSLRPRHLFMSGNATIGGTLAVTGTSTLTGVATMTNPIATTTGTTDYDLDVKTATYGRGAGIRFLQGGSLGGTRYNWFAGANAVNNDTFEIIPSTAADGTTFSTPVLTITRLGVLNAAANTATPAGGSTSARLVLGTTAGFGVYYGSGAPTVSAAQGSVYLRSDGSSTSTRLYVNTDGGTTWTNVTTAA